MALELSIKYYWWFWKYYPKLLKERKQTVEQRFTWKFHISSFPWFWLNGQNKILPNMTTCTTDRFQLTAPCNSLSNKYLFIEYYCGRSKLPLARDSVSFQSCRESGEINIHSVFITWHFQVQSRTRRHFILSVRKQERALTPASSRAVGFLVLF